MNINDFNLSICVLDAEVIPRLGLGFLCIIMKYTDT